MNDDHTLTILGVPSHVRRWLAIALTMLALLCCSAVVHQTMAAIDSYQPCMRWVGSLTIVFFEVRLVQDLGMQSSWS